MSELLPCPFCGAEAQLVDHCGWEIDCKCGVNMCLPESDKPALIAAWNRRAPSAAPASVPGWAPAYLSGSLISDSLGHKVKLHFDTRADAEAAFEDFIAMQEGRAARPAAPAPTDHKLMPRELTPAIKDAMKRWTDFTTSCWQDIWNAV